MLFAQSQSRLDVTTSILKVPAIQVKVSENHGERCSSVVEGLTFNHLFNLPKGVNIAGGFLAPQTV